MSKQYMPLGGVPDCCRGCDYLDYGDELDRGYDTAWCRRALMFPTKKQSCSMRNKPYKHHLIASTAHQQQEAAGHE